MSGPGPTVKKFKVSCYPFLLGSMIGHVKFKLIRVQGIPQEYEVTIYILDTR